MSSSKIKMPLVSFLSFFPAFLPFALPFLKSGMATSKDGFSNAFPDTSESGERLLFLFPTMADSCASEITSASTCTASSARVADRVNRISLLGYSIKCRLSI